MSRSENPFASEQLALEVTDRIVALGSRALYERYLEARCFTQVASVACDSVMAEICMRFPSADPGEVEPAWTCQAPDAPAIDSLAKGILPVKSFAPLPRFCHASVVMNARPKKALFTPKDLTIEAQPILIERSLISGEQDALRKSRLAAIHEKLKSASRVRQEERLSAQQNAQVKQRMTSKRHMVDIDGTLSFVEPIQPMQVPLISLEVNLVREENQGAKSPIRKFQTHSGTPEASLAREAFEPLPCDQPPLSQTMKLLPGVAIVEDGVRIESKDQRRLC